MRVDPRTATPCRTVAFSGDGDVLVEANYLGFVSVRHARTGDLLRRFLAQTALVETVRFEEGTGLLLLVGAGFEGGRDCGIVKVIDPRRGTRLAELRGHTDDVTDVMTLPGERRRVVSVGLDRRVVVHDLGDPGRSWAWTDYEDYLNTCAARSRHDGTIAIVGDSPYTYVLDLEARSVLARLDTPGDTNGLVWSEDGRHICVGDDAGRLLYFDGAAGWRLAGEVRIGGAAKRMVVDPARPDRALVAAYDGRIWSVPRSPGQGEAFVEVDRRRGMWGINVAATATRLAVPTFMDRACLLARDASAGGVTEDIGPEPQPTFGCNWVAVHPSREEIAVTHDDGSVRVRDASTGALRRVLGPDTASLLMGAAFHPRLPLLASIDFYGELLVYETTTGRVEWRRDLGFGPGITVDFSPCGRWLAAGGYHAGARVVALDGRGQPSLVQELDAPNRGVVKGLCFAGSDRLLVASGDGSLVVHDRRGDRFVAVRSIRGTPPMELCNGVAVSPDGRIAYVGSRDQTLRAFDLDTGAELATGLAHVRGVKTVHASECGRHVVTGSYDRSVMLWNADDLSVRMPPVRLANSGVSCVRWRKGRVYACSFDGMTWAIDGGSGEILWHRTSAHVAGGA